MTQLSLEGSFQQPVLDLPAAREARNVALDASQEASPSFQEAAAAAIKALAAQGTIFIVDDVWEALEGHWKAVPDKRAMGAALRSAARDGIIRPTAEFRPSAQVKCHANPRRVWAPCLEGSRD